MSSGNIEGIILIATVVCLALNGLLASAASNVAAEKGYSKRKWFHMCFWLGLFSYVIIAAMPDLVMRRKQDQTNELLSDIIMAMKPSQKQHTQKAYVNQSVTHNTNIEASVIPAAVNQATPSGDKSDIKPRQMALHAKKPAGPAGNEKPKLSPMQGRFSVSPAPDGSDETGILPERENTSMPTTAEDNEKRPTLINLSKAIIRPDWLVEGSTAWVKCPRCGEKRPLNFIKSTGKCPACGAIAVDIPKEETPVSSAAAESEEIVPTAKSRNPFINPDWLIEGSTTWVKCPQCGQKRPMDFIRATGKCPACGASALNKQSD